MSTTLKIKVSSIIEVLEAKKAGYEAAITEAEATIAAAKMDSDSLLKELADNLAETAKLLKKGDKATLSCVSRGRRGYSISVQTAERDYDSNLYEVERDLGNRKHLLQMLEKELRLLRMAEEGTVSVGVNHPLNRWI